MHDHESDATPNISFLLERRYRSPFLMCLTMMFVLQFSGVNYVAAYAVDIFQVGYH